MTGSIPNTDRLWHQAAGDLAASYRDLWEAVSRQVPSADVIALQHYAVVEEVIAYCSGQQPESKPSAVMPPMRLSTTDTRGYHH